MSQPQFFWLCILFVFTGVVNTLLGPFLPEAVRVWGLRESFAGLFFPAQFSAGMVGTLSMPWITRRIGMSGALFLSFLTMAAGVTAAGASSANAALAAVACWGYGLGLNIPTANTMAARGGLGPSDARLSTLNFAWGIGAVVGPSVLSHAFSVWSFTTSLRMVGGLLLAAAVFSLRVSGRGRAIVWIDTGKHTEVPPPSFSALTATLLFFYVGVESAFSGWLPLTAQRAYNLGPSVAGLTVSVFWGAFLTVRGVLPILLRSADARPCVSTGIVLFMVGVLLVVVGRSQVHVIAGAVLAGSGLGPAFPLLLSAYYKLAGPGAEKHIGLVFAASAMGGACVPPLVGIVASRAGTLRAGLAVVLAAVSVVLLLHSRLMDRASSGRGSSCC